MEDTKKVEERPVLLVEWVHLSLIVMLTSQQKQDKIDQIRLQCQPNSKQLIKIGSSSLLWDR